MSILFLPLHPMMFSILIPDRAAGMYNMHRAVRDNMDPTQPRDSKYMSTCLLPDFMKKNCRMYKQPEVFDVLIAQFAIICRGK